ncbi:amidophosphoribosyltransferase [Companilactobacillus nantensis]|uniref:Amidophosphoribosyltransferase n=1 Tax=Companilactobacillus nantensis DSM 16982 TaxID=1423774 RepID=A0A0R1WJE0_9LACO|nr:amidophosphoribosyltransferase [Companilactobacillus nantensis]KRM17992.1 amidophosphoribosyltransferase [Companilactobacillus nantensis DSM 16982]GEO63655.1 amidophosphoribosyltransferase [Companilactobacillus nantensis]
MPNEVRSLNEECGVFGVWGAENANYLTYLGLHSLQHRGQEGAGIVANDGQKLRAYRNLGLLTQVFSKPEYLNSLVGDAAIGHVRYSTAGENKIENVQPLLFDFTDNQIALAHNGNLTNAITLKKELEEKGHIFKSSSDSEVLVHLIKVSNAPTFREKMIEALNKIQGGFAYLLMTKDEMIVALDSHGFRPLSIGQLDNGAYVVASETCALDAVGAKLVHNVQPGELITINNDGMKLDRWTTDTTLAICSMEFIYFARPDSDILGVNVHSARKRMGANLAKEYPAPGDIVVGVPNSSLSAASGYAEASGLPYEMGLIKNQYMGREFIQPTKELREKSVRQKLAAVKGVVRGKRVILVDDSIVRGTTCAYIVQLLKDAGATEVHLRIASPRFMHPCFYGIDIQEKSELIAAHKSIPEMNQMFGSDSLEFLSEDGLIDAIGLDSDAPYSGLDMSYFNGDYPTYLYDYESKK